MAVTGATVISKATAMLGKGGTTVWNYYGLAKGTAWCAAFVSYIMAKAGTKSLFYGGKSVFYVPYAQEWLKKNCTHVKMADAKPGDIVVFTWDGEGNNSEKGSRDHIGFIRKAGTSKTAYTIEGNTSGGIVANKTRALNGYTGYIVLSMVLPAHRYRLKKRIPVHSRRSRRGVILEKVTPARRQNICKSC